MRRQTGNKLSFKRNISAALGIFFVRIKYLFLLTLCTFACKEEARKLFYNNGELHYTENVPQEEARKLCEFLAKNGFYFDGVPKSVQIDKQDSSYIFRAVVKEGADKDSSGIKPFVSLGILLSSDVFLDTPVIVEMCNPNFKTLRRIPYSQ